MIKKFHNNTFFRRAFDIIDSIVNVSNEGLYPNYILFSEKKLSKRATFMKGKSISERNHNIHQIINGFLKDKLFVSYINNNKKINIWAFSISDMIWGPFRL